MQYKDLGYIYLGSNVGITAAVFFLPLLLTARNISDLEIGYLAIFYSVALFFSNSIFGKLTDSRGRKPFLLLGLLSSSLTTFSYILPDTFFAFALVRFFNGISLGMFPAAILSIASDRGTPMGELSAWRAMGWTLGAFLNGLISDILNIEYAFILGGVLFFGAFIYAIVRDTGGVNYENKIKKVNNEDKPILKYRLVIRTNWKIYLTVMIRHGAGASIWIYWSLFLAKDLGLSNSQIGVVLMINTISQVIVMRYFTDKGDSEKMFALGTFLSSLAFFSFPLTSNFIEICITQVLLGISFAFFLVGGLRTAEVNGNKIGMVGTATGLYQASFSVSQLIGPLLAILIYTRYETYTSIMNIAGFITLGGAILYLILMKLKS